MKVWLEGAAKCWKKENIEKFPASRVECSGDGVKISRSRIEGSTEEIGGVKLHVPRTTSLEYQAVGNETTCDVYL